MDARINIVGNLTQDVRSFTNKYNKDQSLFRIAIDVSKNETYFFDCFLNYHLSEKELERYTKGALVSISGKYNQFYQKINFDNSIAIRRVINVIEHNTTILKGRYIQNISVNFNGYVIDKPVFQAGITTFEVAEKILEDNSEENKRFIVELPYQLSNVDAYTENSFVYIYGYYSEELNMHPLIGTRIKRRIFAKDIELIISQPKTEKKRTLGEILAR